METREVLGLDDHGRELILTRMTSSRGDHAVEMVTAFSSDGKAEVIYCETIEDELAVAAVFARQKEDQWYSDLMRNVSAASIGTVTGRVGSKSLHVAAQSLPRNGPMILTPNSFSFFDEAGNERVKLGKLDLRLQGQPNRKPQPNRGPLGRKDWL
jgi:hypothetical protein